MNSNMGNRDRALRGFVVAPVAVLVGALVGPASVAAIVLYALGGIMAATAAAGFCPLYVLFGVHTRGRTPLPH